MSDSHWVKARKTGPLVIHASLDEESVTASTKSGADIVSINVDSLSRHALLAPALLAGSIALLYTCVADGSDISLFARVLALIASIAACLYLIPEALCLLTMTVMERHSLSQDEINAASNDELVLAAHEQEDIFGRAQEAIINELERRSLDR